MEDDLVTKVQRMRTAFERAFGFHLVTYFVGPHSIVAEGIDGNKPVVLTDKHVDFIRGYIRSLNAKDPPPP